MAYCSVYQRKWREANRDKIRAWHKANYEANRDKLLAYHRGWREANPDKWCAAKCAWREANPDKVRAYGRASSLKWYRTHPDKARARECNYRARKLQSEGTHTAADVAAIRALQNNCCAICKEKLGRHGHLDHIIPLSRGGSNWPHNLQWLCASCNLRKYAKDPRAELIPPQIKNSYC